MREGLFVLVIVAILFPPAAFGTPLHAGKGTGAPPGAGPGSEAAFEGRAGVSLPLFCFHYGPALQGRFFTLSQVAGAVTLAVLVALFLFLRAEEKRKRANGKGD